MQKNKIATVLAMLALLMAGQAVAEDTPSESPNTARELKADTNQDGKVSYEEFKASHEKRQEAQFKRMDSNGDGFIDEAERKQMHEKMRDMRAKRKQQTP